MIGQRGVRLINVAIRANEIMMDRIRNTILEDLFARPSQTHAFFHLGAAVSRQTFPNDALQLLHALSHMRTDLDSFTDLEAYTLMFYGYRLVSERLPGPVITGADWRFLRIEDMLRDESQRQVLLRHLEVGSKQFFKVFWLRKPMPYAIVLAALMVPIGAGVLRADTDCGSVSGSVAGVSPSSLFHAVLDRWGTECHMTLYLLPDGFFWASYGKKLSSVCLNAFGNSAETVAPTGSRNSAAPTSATIQKPTNGDSAKTMMANTATLMPGTTVEVKCCAGVVCWVFRVISFMFVSLSS